MIEALKNIGFVVTETIGKAKELSSDLQKSVFRTSCGLSGVFTTVSDNHE